MDENHLAALIGNEREWRKYLIRKLEELSKEQSELRGSVQEMRTWGRIWRGIGGAILAVVVAWFSNKNQ